MNRTSKVRTILYTLWTLLSIASSLLILGDVLGDAAWNGVNFALGVYLLLSVGGALGLLAGLRAAFCPKGLFASIAFISAILIAALSLFFGLSFIISRAPGVPIGDPIYIAGFRTPVVSLYGAAFLFCSVEALLFFPRHRNL